MHIQPNTRTARTYATAQRMVDFLTGLLTAENSYETLRREWDFVIVPCGEKMDRFAAVVFVKRDQMYLVRQIAENGITVVG